MDEEPSPKRAKSDFEITLRPSKTHETWAPVTYSKHEWVNVFAFKLVDAVEASDHELELSFYWEYGETWDRILRMSDAKSFQHPFHAFLILSYLCCDRADKILPQSKKDLLFTVDWEEGSNHDGRRFHAFSKECFWEHWQLVEYLHQKEPLNKLNLWEQAKEVLPSRLSGVDVKALVDHGRHVLRLARENDETHWVYCIHVLLQVLEAVYMTEGSNDIPEDTWLLPALTGNRMPFVRDVGFPKEACVIAGSAPFFMRKLGHIPQPSDMDMWIVGPTAEARARHFRALVEFFANNHANVWFAMYGSLVTVVIPGISMYVQIIYTDRQRMSQVVADFDLAPCRQLWHKNHYYHTPSARAAEEDHILVVGKWTEKIMDWRVNKWAKRGFMLVNPQENCAVLAPDPKEGRFYFPPKVDPCPAQTAILLRAVLPCRDLVRTGAEVIDKFSYQAINSDRMYGPKQVQTELTEPEMDRLVRRMEKKVEEEKNVYKSPNRRVSLFPSVTWTLRTPYLNVGPSQFSSEHRILLNFNLDDPSHVRLKSWIDKLDQKVSRQRERQRQRAIHTIVVSRFVSMKVVVTSKHTITWKGQKSSMEVLPDWQNLEVSMDIWPLWIYRGSSVFEELDDILRWATNNMHFRPRRPPRKMKIYSALVEHEG